MSMLCPFLNECACDFEIPDHLLEMNVCRRKAFRHRVAQWRGRCAYCNVQEKLTLDHFVPRHRGGLNHAANYVPACAQCNHSKSSSSPYAWYSKQPFFTKERWAIIVERLALCPLELDVLGAI